MSTKSNFPSNHLTMPRSINFLLEELQFMNAVIFKLPQILVFTQNFYLLTFFQSRMNFVHEVDVINEIYFSNCVILFYIIHAENNTYIAFLTLTHVTNILFTLKDLDFKIVNKSYYILVHNFYTNL